MGSVKIDIKKAYKFELPYHGKGPRPGIYCIDPADATRFVCEIAIPGLKLYRAGKTGILTFERLLDTINSFCYVQCNQLKLGYMVVDMGAHMKYEVRTYAGCPFYTCGGNSYCLNFIRRDGHLFLDTSKKQYPPWLLPEKPSDELIPLDVSEKDMHAALLEAGKTAVKLVKKEGLDKDIAPDVAYLEEVLKVGEEIYSKVFRKPKPRRLRRSENEADICEKLRSTSVRLAHLSRRVHERKHAGESEWEPKLPKEELPIVEIKEICHDKEAKLPELATHFVFDLDLPGLDFSGPNKTNKISLKSLLSTLSDLYLLQETYRDCWLCFSNVGGTHEYKLCFIQRGTYLALDTSKSKYPSDLAPSRKENPLLYLGISAQDFTKVLLEAGCVAYRLIKKERKKHKIKPKDLNSFKEVLKKGGLAYYNYYEIGHLQQSGIPHGVMNLPYYDLDFKVTKVEGDPSDPDTYLAYLDMIVKRADYIWEEIVEKKVVKKVTYDPLAMLAHCLRSIIALHFWDGPISCLKSCTPYSQKVPPNVKGGHLLFADITTTECIVSFKMDFSEKQGISFLNSYAKAFVHAAESLEALMKRKGHLEAYIKADPYVYSEFKWALWRLKLSTERWQEPYFSKVIGKYKRKIRRRIEMEVNHIKWRLSKK